MIKKNIHKSRLTPEDIKRFKASLLAKRDEILNNVHSMEDQTLKKIRTDLSNMPLHMADSGSDTFEIENTLGLMDSERKLLQEIDDALERIEHGTYGICEGNAEPIPKARLQAIPWARYCVTCASQLEKGLYAKEKLINKPDNNQPVEEQNDDTNISTDEQNND
jgi:RNA polymerase-binding protein DksA